MLLVRGKGRCYLRCIFVDVYRGVLSELSLDHLDPIGLRGRVFPSSRSHKKIAELKGSVDLGRHAPLWSLLILLSASIINHSNCYQNILPPLNNDVTLFFLT
jgi:hypothetical protein